MNKYIVVLGLAIMLFGVILTTMRKDFNYPSLNIDIKLYIYYNLGLLVVLNGLTTFLIGLAIPNVKEAREE